MNYSCREYNYCENYGKCFEYNSTFPTTSICICEKCYYGSRCQFSTNGFSLSLDSILGYDIKPFVSFLKQSNTVKITAALTIIMFILALIHGSLSILTFRRKMSMEIGGGIYFLITSIISILTISIFTIKYWLLVLIRMNIITNRSFILINCLLIDVLLKIVLSSGDWLIACNAIERVFICIKGMTYNKSKSKCIAKYVTPIILLLISLSYLHDPFYRQLFYHPDEQQPWCVVFYSSKLKIFDKSINLFHFITPFLIHILSGLIIIIYEFYFRSIVGTKSICRTILFSEINRRKYLLISPCILIILSLPRIIILLLSQCMEPVHNPWLFLAGYYISFVPPLLIIILFVLPFKRYKKEFLAVIRKER